MIFQFQQRFKGGQLNATAAAAINNRIVNEVNKSVVVAETLTNIYYQLFIWVCVCMWVTIYLSAITERLQLMCYSLNIISATPTKCQNNATISPKAKRVGHNEKKKIEKYFAAIDLDCVFFEFLVFVFCFFFRVAAAQLTWRPQLICETCFSCIGNAALTSARC